MSEKTNLERWKYKPNIIISSEDFDFSSSEIGRSHYSYKFVESRFRDFFFALGFIVSVERFPQGRSIRQTTNDFIHIAFRSTENLRIISGAYNICHFAWEFDVMSDSNLASQSILGNQIHMLSLFDEIWTPSNYTKSVLESHGLKNIWRVPPPICRTRGARTESTAEAIDAIGNLVATPLRLSTGASRPENAAWCAQATFNLRDHPTINGKRQTPMRGDVYLTVCNPGDLRKNVVNLIEAFRSIRSQDDVLIVKLIVPNKGDFRNTAQFDLIAPLYKGAITALDDNVLFISDFITEIQMTSIYILSDFYICASFCEGFNLPLLEAMSVGAIPISPHTTAMRDYITEGNAIIVSTNRFVGYEPGMAADVAQRPYAIDVPAHQELADAIFRAKNLTEAGRNAKKEQSINTSRSMYCYYEIEHLVNSRFACILDEI